jgi:outer membrane protein TolC
MKRILVSSCLVILALSGSGQQKLSLQDAINFALKNSYDIQLTKDSLDISIINNNIGVAGGLPSVTGTLSDNEQITSINQKYADPSKDTKRDNVGTNNSAFGITGSFLLYNGGRVMATKKRLEELALQNLEMLNFKIQNTIAGVAAKYYDVVRQQSYLKTILQSIDVSKKKLEILQYRKEVGVSNNADVIQAQLDLNALLQSQKSQQLVIDQAKTDLLIAIFLKADSPVIISDTILVDKSITIDSIRNAVMKNPALTAADQQIQINELIEKETAALRYPSLRATTGYNFTSNYSAAGFTLLNQSYGPFIGLNLSIPIYAGGASKRQQQVAEVNTKIAKSQRDQLYLVFESGTLRTYQAYKSNLNQLKEEQQNYQLSIQLLDLVLQRFQLGQATIIDVQLAQESFENEGYRLVNLSYAAKVAEIELKRLSSKLAL